MEKYEEKREYCVYKDPTIKLEALKFGRKATILNPEWKFNLRPIPKDKEDK